MRLSTLERKLLNSIQGQIPFCSQPFKVLAEGIGMEEAEFIAKLKELKNRCVVRRFSAVLSHNKLGYKSTLLAIKVPKKRLEGFVEEIVAYPEITHCYLRKNEYNLWVVFIYKKDALKKFFNKVRSRFGRKSVLDLKTLRQFKLNTKIAL